MRISLKSALLGLVAVVLVVAFVPAGLLLDRRLVAALEQGVRDDLSFSPRVLADRFANQGSARMMHARDVAVAAGLAEALVAGDTVDAVARARAVAEGFAGESALLVDEAGHAWLGPSMPASLVDATHDGSMPVRVVQSDGQVGTASLAAVKLGDRWIGAAGVWVPMDMAEAAQLSALTRADVLLTAPDGAPAAYTGQEDAAMGLFALLADQPLTDEVRHLDFRDERYLIVNAELPGGARATFVRSLERELAIVPTLRAVGAAIFGLSLLVALVVGGWFAALLARPVGSLAAAAARISEGDFDAPVDRSTVSEVDQVAEAFEVMRDALAARIAELGAANEALEDRQARLAVLQAELVQRDRLSAASRLLAQLAHEVRNPVASVRNCLEVLRRRVDGDEEASELADLAIDELLRMHELTEQMLDLNRPRSTNGHCDAAAVAADVAALVRMGVGDGAIEVVATAPGPVVAEIGVDALKQVLLNLVQNAQEALGDSGRVEIRVSEAGANARIDVIDDGPGIPDDALPQVFDPFFTTKADVRGVGLGLFTAAGLVRSHGGRIAAANRAEGRGARLTVEIPLVARAAAEASA